ncbi:histidine kinase [Massilia sp. Root418]|jgi:two-component system sensor histidine kinase CreC|uniref:two-component system sensor histidine kinase CreC n=1 Tax=Massilia sp. Root418 TaxID=1736532 RepID=UPI0006F98051|nr:two-component system sensor histidine kinase CreC [Massilia sp. Root418]KQW88039.1 histidine kinase [Massilia sp. Root418]
MKIGLRILLGYFLVVGLAAWFLLNVFMAEVKPGVRATQEDTLVGTAHMLAAAVAGDVKAGTLQSSGTMARMRDALHGPIRASVSGIDRERLDYRVYITDARGIVLFDSDGRDTGKDYSRWNDVYLTLRGKYGARSTRSNPDDEDSTVMHVAAPILEQGKLIGVLTVAKPNASVQAFVERSQQSILRGGAVLLGLSLLIGLAVTSWLARALGKLMAYVSAVEAGRKVVLPELGKSEIGTLGRALEAMRARLEGKEYAEQLMHTLAHELKSPIAAIQASAELLQEEMPEQERRHFLGNIVSQNARQKQLIDKLLALVRVEQQQRLEAAESVELHALARQAGGDFAGALAAAGVALEYADAALPGVGGGPGDGSDSAGQGAALLVRGDALLLRQALGNLLDNAIGFSPRGGVVRIALWRAANEVGIDVCDQGPGVPAYAAGRLFERFYSLPRPGGGKSTGLGLPFVREVAALHGGTVSVASAPGGGCCARLALPLPLAI